MIPLDAAAAKYIPGPFGDVQSCTGQEIQPPSAFLPLTTSWTAIRCTQAVNTPHVNEKQPCPTSVYRRRPEGWMPAELHRRRNLWRKLSTCNLMVVRNHAQLHGSTPLLQESTGVPPTYPRVLCVHLAYIRIKLLF